MLPRDLFARPRLIGLLAAITAVLAGAGFMLAAGAPLRLPAVNAGALILGGALWAVLGRGAPGAGRSGVVLALAVALWLTALFGVSVEGATRWIAVGPLTLQPGLIAIPVMLVLFARKPDAVGALGMVAAAAALAAQPDRGLAGALAVGLAVLLATRPAPWTALSAAAAAAAFAWTLAVPDRVPPVPFVEGVFAAAFAFHPLAGAAVAVAAALLLAPALSALRAGPETRAPLLVFAAGWAGLTAAAALGPYPTPLIGAGASAVLGYLVSAALLPSRVES